MSTSEQQLERAERVKERKEKKKAEAFWADRARRIQEGEECPYQRSRLREPRSRIDFELTKRRHDRVGDHSEVLNSAIHNFRILKRDGIIFIQISAPGLPPKSWTATPELLTSEEVQVVNRWVAFVEAAEDIDDLLEAYKTQMES